VGDQATLNDALDTMLVASSETAVVTGRRDVFRGVINVKTIMEAISQANADAESAAGDAPVGLNSGAIPALAVENAVAAESALHGAAPDEPQGTEEPR
ncbi:MAG: ABC transporter, partial [Paeniglutamicibacter sp.]